MDEKKEIIGYFTDDRNIYCIECINKNREIMEKIERAITADEKLSLKNVAAVPGASSEPIRKSG